MEAAIAGTPRLFQINVSDGGVPKLPVHQVQVTPEGITGDRQADQEHHGGPRQAICLYALERIVALQEEGHPIFPGSTGENLTVAGLDWAQVIPGARLLLGDGTVVEVTKYTKPCPKIEHSFADGEVDRMAHQAHPGWARVYARVLVPGNIQTGDRIYLLGD